MNDFNRLVKIDPRRLGMTLIELLVAVAVIGLVAALLLPAIQSARESAMRIRCVQNLRQIGLAVSSYESVMGVLPSNDRFSPHSQILQFLEQPAVFDALNFGGPGVDGLDNATAKRTAIGVFICPSDKTPNGQTNGQTGWSSYPANCGLGFDIYGHNSNGAFPVDSIDRSSFAYRDFPDGTSTTSAFAEWCTGDPGDPLNAKRGVFKTPVARHKDIFERCSAACQAPVPPIVPANGWLKGRDWLPGDWGSTLYNHTLGINARSCKCIGVVQAAWTAGSYHHGGANVLFVDGHASFVRETTALQTWRSLGSRNGGEAIHNAP